MSDPPVRWRVDRERTRLTAVERPLKVQRVFFGCMAIPGFILGLVVSIFLMMMGDEAAIAGVALLLFALAEGWWGVTVIFGRRQTVITAEGIRRRLPLLPLLGHLDLAASEVRRLFVRERRNRRSGMGGVSLYVETTDGSEKMLIQGNRALFGAEKLEELARSAREVLRLPAE